MIRIIAISISLTSCATHMPYGECFANGGVPATAWRAEGVRCVVR